MRSAERVEIVSGLSRRAFLRGTVSVALAPSVLGIAGLSGGCGGSGTRDSSLPGLGVVFLSTIPIRQRQFAVGPNGDVYTSSNEEGLVRHPDLGRGNPTTLLPPGAVFPGTPQAISTTGEIYLLAPAGFAPSVADGLPTTDLAPGDRPCVLVLSANGERLRAFAPKRVPGSTTAEHVSGTLIEPRRLSLHPSGIVYLVDNAGGGGLPTRVMRWDAQGRALGPWATPDGTLIYAYGEQVPRFDSAGNVYVKGGPVQVFTSDGVLIRTVTQTLLSERYNPNRYIGQPDDWFAVNEVGEVYMVHAYQLVKFDVNGKVVGIDQSRDGSFDGREYVLYFQNKLLEAPLSGSLSEIRVLQVQ